MFGSRNFAQYDVFSLTPHLGNQVAVFLDTAEPNPKVWPPTAPKAGDQSPTRTGTVPGRYLGAQARVGRTDEIIIMTASDDTVWVYWTTTTNFRGISPV